MADNNLTVSSLSVDITVTGVFGSETIDALVSFTANGATWSINIPGMTLSAVRMLRDRLHTDLSTDEEVSRLAGGSFDVELLR